MIQRTTDTFDQQIHPAGSPFPADADVFLTTLATFQSLGNFKWEQVAAITAIHAVLEGEGTVLHNGIAYEAKRGDLFIFRKGEHYHYYDHPEKPWNYIYILISGSRLDALLEQIGLTADQPILNVSDFDRFWIKLNILKQEFEKEAVSGISAVRAGWELLELLKERCERHTPSLKRDVTETARQIIKFNPQTVTNVNTLADALQVSRVTLFRSFKKRYGISIKEYIEQVRFERIQTLLKASSLPISDIARMGGFTDPLYFSRAFRKRYGVPPAQWRSMDRTSAQASSKSQVER
ncbi:MAG: AraC family transcriptional regulator [Kiritimatiellaceae bacterium]|nr:AraC family transcriptional regulator [Kiritimatiellaceae bacterium]